MIHPAWGPSLDRNEEQDPCLHGSEVEQDKEEDGFVYQVGKRPRKEPLFGGVRQKIVFLGTRQRDKRSHRRAGNKKPRRCCSDDRKHAESEIGPNARALTIAISPLADEVTRK